MDVTILVGTFGSQDWADRGRDKAEHLRNKFPLRKVLHLHGEQLHQVRNALAAAAKSEWLCFVDADDDLEKGYFNEMHRLRNHADLLAPMVWWKEEGSLSIPVCLENRDMEASNQCVIGTLIRKEMFDSVGGFKDWRAWEDWALFLSCYRRGAKIKHIYGSTYIANVSPNSRNNTIENGKQLWLAIKASS